MKKIKSIATNTCNLHHAVWDILAANPKLKHALFILYDSHGLQLLIKDLLELPSIGKVFQKVLKIVNTLKKMKHHLGILCSYQLSLYGPKHAPITSNILCLGTQVDLVDTVIRSEETLPASASAVFPSKKEKLANPIKTYLLDPEFWSRLDNLITILRPIHEDRKISELNSDTADQVYERWL